MRWCSLAAAALCLLWATARCASACVPDPGAEPLLDEAYTGYAPTGYKGALERDALWFRFVRPVKHPDGSTGYVLKRAKRAQRTEYESITPLPLGPKAVYFMAYRQGCNALLDSAGKPTPLPLFRSLYVEDAGRYTDADAPHPARAADAAPVLLNLALGQPGSGNRIYAWFAQGRWRAISKTYAAPHIVPQIAGTLRPPRWLQPVSAPDRPGAVGLLDLRTLQERLAPIWLGVGALYDRPGPHGGHQRIYLLAKDTQGLHLLRDDGTPLPLPRFDQARLTRDWMPGGKAPAIIETIDQQARQCRLYSAALTPLLAQPVPLRRYARGCLSTVDARDSALLAFSSAGKTQVYRKVVRKRQAALEPLALDIPGTLVYTLPTGSMVLQDPQPSLAPYRLVDRRGHALAARPFTAFLDLGCGHVRLQRDGVWLSLRRDGTLSTLLTVPFSC